MTRFERGDKVKFRTMDEILHMISHRNVPSYSLPHNTGMKAIVRENQGNELTISSGGSNTVMVEGLNFAWRPEFFEPYKTDHFDEELFHV